MRWWELIHGAAREASSEVTAYRGAISLASPVHGDSTDSASCSMGGFWPSPALACGARRPVLSAVSLDVVGWSVPDGAAHVSCCWYLGLYPHS